MLTRHLAVLSLLLAAGAAIAQPSDPRPADALRGPAVSDRNVPGVNGSFGEPGGDKRKFIGEQKLPPRVFRNALETIMGPDAPENLRVTDEQCIRYQGWMDDFQKSIGAYMRQHRDELEQLRRKTGEPRRPGAGGPPNAPKSAENSDQMKPDAAPAADAKETGAARERLQVIMAGAPKIEDLYTKIWSELKPEQQRAVDSKIDEFRAQQAKEREDNYVRQKTKKKNPDAARPEAPQPKPDGTPQGEPLRRRLSDAAPGRAPDGQPAPRGFGIDPERRDRLMQLFAQLSPEQQEQLLQRLERAREENGGKLPLNQLRRGKGGPGAPGEPKPAPAPDDSMMPPSPSVPPAPTPAPQQP